MLRTLPVAAELLGFVAAGQPDPVMVWGEDSGRRVMTDKQEVDDAGQLVWTAYVMPTLAERPEVLQVRVSAPQQPVLTLFAPVALDNLSCNVRVDKAGKLAQYWSAAGIRDAAQNGGRRGGQEHKAEGQAA